MRIPLYKPNITNSDIKSAVAVLKSNKLSRGERVLEFEQKFARYIGKKYAIAVNSGTSGLHVLVKALGWGRGDELITSPFSFVASGNCILFEEATPVFADIDSRTLNISADNIENLISKKTKGIILVHILGLPVDYSSIFKIKNKYRLEIIEDACESIGKPSRNFRVGSLGRASVYSFYENKQITTGGEGGIIVTDDFVLAKKCKAIRDQGRSNKKDWLNHVVLGFNFRLTEMQSAIGISQLKNIDKILKHREFLAKYYNAKLKKIAGVVTPQMLSGARRSWFTYYIVVNSAGVRDKLSVFLQKNSIATSTNYFPPIYKFPMYRKLKAKNCPVAEDMSKRLLMLPFFNELTKKEINYIVSKIDLFMKNYE